MTICAENKLLARLDGVSGEHRHRRVEVPGARVEMTAGHRCRRDVKIVNNHIIVLAQRLENNVVQRVLQSQRMTGTRCFDKVLDAKKRAAESVMKPSQDSASTASRSAPAM